MDADVRYHPYPGGTGVWTTIFTMATTKEFQIVSPMHTVRNVPMAYNLCARCSIFCEPTCRDCKKRDQMARAVGKEIEWRPIQTAVITDRDRARSRPNIPQCKKIVKVKHRGICVEGPAEENTLKHDPPLVDQMDSGRTNAVAGNDSSAIADAAITLGKAAFNALEGFDSPSVPVVDARSMALSDIPKVVMPLAFKTGDRVMTQRKNFSQVRGVDPSDIRARCQIPSLMAICNWGTSDPVGTEILGRARRANNFESAGLAPITPCTPYAFTGVGPEFMVAHTAPSYYAQFFELVRTDYHFTFEVICTKFHQGQLFIMVQPAADWTAALPNLSQARSCYGASIDLSQCNRTEFVVPYNAFTDYIQTYENGHRMRAAPTHSGGVGGRSRPYCNGYLGVFVQNPLTATSAVVSSSIQVNVWMHLGENLEFFVPRPLADGVRIMDSWLYEDHPADPQALEDQMEKSGDPEVQETNLTAPPAAQPTTGLAVKNLPEVAQDVNVKKSTYEKMVSREYLLKTGILWTTSQVYSSLILDEPIAPLFESAELASSALFVYNEYYRTTVELTVRVNANPMFAGQLLLVHAPVGNANIGNNSAGYSQTIPTLNQYIVAYLTPQTDTRATIQVPWTNIHRVVSTQSVGSVTSTGQLSPASPLRLGEVRLIVLNQLLTGTGSGTQLSITLWGRLIGPYIGFKRANVVRGLAEVVDEGDEEEDCDMGPSVNTTNVVGTADTEWSDSTDSAEKTQCGGSVIRRIAGKQRGYLRTDHTTMRALLRRPMFVLNFQVHSANTGNWSFARRLACRPAAVTMRALVATCNAWSGTLRYHFMSNAGQATELLMKTRHTMFDYIAVATPAPVNMASAKDFTGVTVWRPGEDSVKIVQPAHYHPLSSKYVEPNGEIPADLNYYAGYGSITVNYMFTPLAGASDDMQIDLYQSIGDDFELYICRPMPATITRDLPVFGTIDAETQERLYQSARAALESPRGDGA